jgi:hypothetical protein
MPQMTLRFVLDYKRWIWIGWFASLGNFLIDTPLPKSPHKSVKIAIYCDISLVNGG